MSCSRPKYLKTKYGIIKRISQFKYSSEMILGLHKSGLEKVAKKSW